MLSKTDAARPTPDAAGSSVPVAALIATFALAAALRFIGLQSGLWYDEIVTLVESARQPLRQILTVFPGVNAHPLYSILAHVSTTAFGESAWSLRLPACLFGIASVMMAYSLGARLTTRLEAWAGALVLATSYHHIWFSQNARGYTLLGLLALVSTDALLEIVSRGRRADYLVYTLACAAGIYTHLTMALVVGGQAVVILGGLLLGSRAMPRERLRPLCAAWVGAGVLAGLAYAPFAPNVLAHFGADAPREAARVATASWAIGEALRSILLGAGVPAAIAAAVFAAIGALGVWRRHPVAFGLLVVPGLVTAAAIVALGQPVRPRFFFFLSGAAAIFVGGGIGTVAGAWSRRFTVPPRTAVASIAFVLVALSALSLPRNYRVPKQDFDGAVAFLEAREAQGASIAAAGPACLPLERYYAKAWRCIATAEEWPDARAQALPPLVVYTLADYIDNREVASRLRERCREVRRFEGTLGGGDIVVCEASSSGTR